MTVNVAQSCHTVRPDMPFGIAHAMQWRYPLGSSRPFTRFQEAATRMIVNALKQVILFSLFLLLPLVANAQAEPVATIPAAGI